MKKILVSVMPAKRAGIHDIIGAWVNSWITRRGSIDRRWNPVDPLDVMKLNVNIQFLYLYDMYPVPLSGHYLQMPGKDKKTKGEIEIRKLFGHRVRLLRQEARLSQEALGGLAELEPAYIGSVERAQCNLTLRNIIRLADALNLPVQTLFDFRGVAK